MLLTKEMPVRFATVQEGGYASGNRLNPFGLRWFSINAFGMLEVIGRESQRSKQKMVFALPRNKRAATAASNGYGNADFDPKI